MFYTQYNRPPVKRETNDGQLITESAGYRSSQQIIESMIQCGQRLQVARKEEFDFSSEDKLDLDFNDVTRSPAFSELDAVDLAKELSESLSKQSDVAKQQAKDTKASDDVKESSQEDVTESQN